MATKTSVKPGPKGIPAPKPKATPAEATTAAEAGAVAVGAVPAERAPALKLKELVSRVAEATGGKKKPVRDVVEATLSALGDALVKGEELNLPGLGKARVSRQKDSGRGEILVVRLRVGGKPSQTASADDTAQG